MNETVPNARGDSHWRNRMLVIWLFERGDRVVRLVTRFDQQPGEYVLDMEWPDGLSVAERFREFVEFRSRLIQLEQQLETEQWQQCGSPELIREYWSKFSGLASRD